MILSRGMNLTLKKKREEHMAPLLADADIQL
jgi:hypothetical protein